MQSSASSTQAEQRAPLYTEAEQRAILTSCDLNQATPDRVIAIKDPVIRDDTIGFISMGEPVERAIELAERLAEREGRRTSPTP